MKKKSLLIMLAIVIIIILVVILVVVNNKNDENNIPGNNVNEVPVDNQAETEITLYENTQINTLKSIPIAGTNDYFSITEDVKWGVPSEANGQTTASFDIQIPYRFTVDGIDYEGSYVLGNSSHISVDDANPKYDLEITNLTNEGIVTVLIKTK